MKVQLRQAKFDWLKQYGYRILATEDGSGWTATNLNTGLQLHFTNNTMTVFNELGSKLEGWVELELQAFKLIAVSLGIVRLTAEERDHIQLLLNDNYAVQFVNQLS